MTSRQLVHVSLAIALAVQIAMVLTYGAITGWCFCAINGYPTPPTPPPFVMRFLELAALPAAWATKGLPVPLLFARNLVWWFLAVLVLLHGMALVVRIRIRPGVGTRGRWIRLAGPERVRAWQMLLLAWVLIGLGTAGGAMARRRWLAEAERVFAATMGATSTGRPLPPHVEFSMVERRGKEYVYVYPAPGFAIEADPRESGDHFLDRFVAPYAYGGRVRFPSGARYEFTVLRGKIGWPAQKDGWIVDLYEENIFRR